MIIILSYLHFRANKFYFLSMTLFKLVASSSAEKVADFSQQCSQRVSSVVGAYWNLWYGKQPLSALLRIISFTKMIVMKWIWICKVHHICKPIQFLNFQERSRNDIAMFLLTTVLRIQPHLITPSHWGRRDTLTDGSIRMAWEATRARWRERVVKPLVLGPEIAGVRACLLMISIWRAFSQTTLFTGWWTT